MTFTSFFGSKKSLKKSGIHEHKKEQVDNLDFKKRENVRGSRNDGIISHLRLEKVLFNYKQFQEAGSCKQILFLFQRVIKKVLSATKFTDI